MEERTRLQKAVLVILAVMVVLFGVLTAFSRSREGVAFEGTLLTASREGGVSAYSGKAAGQGVTVTAEEDTVTYDVEGRQRVVYQVEYPLEPIPAADGPAAGETVPGIRILRDGALWFTGGYDEGGWYASDGSFDSGIVIHTPVDPSEPAVPEDLTRRQILAFAQGPELTARGSWLLYGLLVFLTGLAALGTAFPMTLFHLQHACDVRDPEPTDLYMTMQRVGWIISPVLLLAGYLWAVWYLP